MLEQLPSSLCMRSRNEKTTIHSLFNTCIVRHAKKIHLNERAYYNINNKNV